MVVGATARNILSVALFDRLPGRATRDVDIAVAVGSWEELRSLTAGMDGRGSEHAYVVGGVDVDIVPYGAIEAEDRTVLLPNDHRMNVLGFREAFITAETARLPGGMSVRVPTPPGLAILKVVAWEDRHLRTRHDAVDLAEILGWSHEGPLLESLYDTGSELLALYDFDPAQAGAHRFGRDAGLLLGSESHSVLAVLDDEDRLELLANEMGHGSQHAFRLRAFREGMRDVSVGWSPPPSQ